MEENQCKVIIGMHVSKEVRRDPRRRSILGKRHSQLCRQLRQPRVEALTQLLEFGIDAPFFASPESLVDLAHCGYGPYHLGKVSEVARHMILRVITARDWPGRRQVHRVNVDGVIMSA